MDEFSIDFKRTDKFSVVNSFFNENINKLDTIHKKKIFNRSYNCYSYQFRSYNTSFIRVYSFYSNKTIESNYLHIIMYQKLNILEHNDKF